MHKKRNIVLSISWALLAVLLLMGTLKDASGANKPRLQLNHEQQMEIQILDASDLYQEEAEQALQNLDASQDLDRTLRLVKFLAWMDRLTELKTTEEIENILTLALSHKRYREWSMLKSDMLFRIVSRPGVDGPSLFEDLIRDVRALNDPEGTAYALAFYAYYLMDNKRFDAAYKNLVEANDILKSTDSPSLLVVDHVKSALCQALAYLDNHEVAINAHLELDTFYEKYGIRSRRAFNLYNLGFIYRRVGTRTALDRAYAYYQKSMALAKSVEAQDTIAMNHYGLSVVTSDLKQYDQSIAFALKALEFFDEENDSGWRPHILRQLAQSYAGAGQHDKALETVALAEKTFPKANSEDLNELDFIRFQIHRKMDDWKAAALALEKYTEQYKILAEERSKEEYQRASVNLGLQYAEERNQRLKEQVDLLKKFRWMTMAASFLMLVSFVALVIVWRQHRTIHASRQQMKEVLDNIDEGILMLDKNLCVLPGYSPYLDQIFPQRGGSLVHHPIQSLLFGDAAAAHESILLRESLLASFGEEQLTWDLNAQHLPFEIKLSNRLLSLHWQPLLNDQGAIRSVLLAVRDITRQRALEDTVIRENHRRETLQIKLEEILVQDMTAVKSFVAGLQKEVPHFEGSDDSTLRKKMHGWKGAARVLGLKQLAAHLHHMEAPAEDQDRAELWQALKTHLDEYLHLLAPMEALPQKNSLMDFAGQYARELRRLEEAGYAVQGILVEDAVHWQPETLHAVHEAVLHGVSNAIDHGFLRRGQPQRAAHLSIRAHNFEQDIEVTIRDNGAGIDEEKLRAVAQQRGMISLPKDILSLLFEEGFSTAASATETSGRGVGLSAVLAICKEQGGSAQLEMASEGGTILRLRLPIDRAEPKVS